MQVTGRPTANALQFENLENEIYTCAPGENNTPCYMLMDDKLKFWLFQTCFHMIVEVSQPVVLVKVNYQ